MELLQREKTTYSKTVNSNIGWVGEIPMHWDMIRLKHIFFEKKIVHNSNLNCGSISFGKVVTKDDSSIPVSTKASYQEVLQGEFLINPLNLNYDLKSLRIALSGLDVVVSSGYIVIKNHLDVDKIYFKWLLHRYDVAYMKLLGSGVRQTINFNHIANSLLPLPPKSEQTAIANFLDDKTAKIDQAIAQKERMIKLLQERKQIIIQNAVTKGLDPNVKMKDSGVEWIGDIPEHWGVKRLKHLAIIRGSQVDPKISPYKEMILIAPNHLEQRTGNIIQLETAEQQGADSGKYLAKQGDIIYSKIRPELRKVCIAPESCLCSADMYAIKPNRLITTEYLMLVFLGEQFNDFMVNQSMRVAMPKVNRTDVSNYPIIFPAISEQKKIVEYVHSKKDEIKKAENNLVTQIKKLKEYKTTLIDHAVTGKIKVS